MILKFITNSPKIAAFATKCGVDRIFIDLEKIGKKERQGHLNTHIVSHTVQDVSNIRKRLPEAEIMVRVNPIHESSQSEINQVIHAGADIVMLPMFTQQNEVQRFIELVDGRSKVSLLLETPQALVRINKILKFSRDIDEIHIGLNDLHLGMNLNFMFELLSGGIVEFLAKKIKQKNIRFGFGGIARIGSGVVPAELILGEHVRLGSEMVILSRSFHDEVESIVGLKEKIDFNQEIERVRTCINEWQGSESKDFEENKEKLQKRVNNFVEERVDSLESKIPGSLSPSINN